MESKLGPLGTSAIEWPIVPAPGDCGDGGFGGMKIGRGNRSTRRKPAPAPLCPPQILLSRKILPLPGLELRPHGRPAHSQSLYRLRYPSSPSMSQVGFEPTTTVFERAKTVHAATVIGNWGTNPTLTWIYWGNPRKAWNRIDDGMAEIWTEHFPNTNLERYHYSSLMPEARSARFWSGMISTSRHSMLS
jgi:hypothetical protein